MKSLQAKMIWMLSLMLAVSLLLAVFLVMRASEERMLALSYGLMEKVAGHLNVAAGWQAIERGTGATILGSGNPAANLLNRFAEVGGKGDEEVKAAIEKMDALRVLGTDSDLEAKYRQWQEDFRTVGEMRGKVREGKLQKDEWVRATTANIDSEFALRDSVFAPHDRREQVLYYNSVVRANVATLCEYAGRERAALGNLIATGKQIPPDSLETLKSWRAMVDHASRQVVALKDVPGTPPELATAIGQFQGEFLGTYQKLREQVYAASREGKPYPVDGAGWINGATVAINTGLHISEVIGNLSSKAADEIRKNARDSMILNSGLFVFSLAVFLSVVYFIRRSVIAPINRVIEGLEVGSQQIASASGEISSASQSLAEGATQQAAALEETTVSLNKIADNSRKNAGHAGEANSSMQNTGAVVMEGDRAMKEMEAAMDSIKKSSAEISKIIKVIEEIAFQTNLLALNAAVEAARAGEHGKGFAVVAEEVRNLAQRSATASKDTATLIENAVKKTGEGEGIVRKLAVSLGEISSSTQSTGTLVNDITEASREQAQGVDQVKQAITQMDKVTQQNAATAEQSAAASEELNAQAETLYELVGDLTRLVTGVATDRRPATGAAPRKIKTAAPKKPVMQK